jgi:glycosyltransferase involved in cell wall biosynthesis
MAKVTVCIPTYNRQDLLPFAIDSVLAQSLTNWQLIVCDDGSTDGTPKVMDRYSQDSRIIYNRHPHNIGKSNNMRSGFTAATGEYFIKFDDDDRLEPEFLAKTTAILDREPTVDFVGTDHWLIDLQNQRQPEATDCNSQRWGRATLPPGPVANLLKVVFVNQSFQVGATLFRLRSLQEVDFMRPNLGNCEDNDLFVRLALAGKQGYYLPQRLMDYRIHAEQQGLNRAIPYLEDKICYLEYFHFDSQPLEEVRRVRLGESQLLLGLRLIERGESRRGRDLINAARSQIGGSSKATVGLLLSYVPFPLRPWAFATIRRLQT